MSDPKKYRIPVILPENPVTVLTESAALLSAKLALAEKINLPSVTLGKTDGEPQEVTSMRATLTNDGYLLYRDKKKPVHLRQDRPRDAAGRDLFSDGLSRLSLFCQGLRGYAARCRPGNSGIPPFYL